MADQELPGWLPAASAVGGFLVLTVKPLVSWAVDSCSAVLSKLQGFRKSLTEPRRKANALTAWEHGFEASSKISAILAELRSLPEVRRALLIKSTNGGGVPSSPVSPVYTTILDEEHDPELSTVLPWRRVLVTEHHYVTLLHQVFSDGIFDLDVSKLGPLDPVRVYYEAEGTTHSLVLRVLATPTQLFYLSVHITADEFSPELSGRAQLASRELQAVLEEHAGLVVKEAL